MPGDEAVLTKPAPKGKKASEGNWAEDEADGRSSRDKPVDGTSREGETQGKKGCRTTPKYGREGEGAMETARVISTLYPVPRRPVQ